MEHQARDLTPSPRPAARGTVLVVDDEPAAREALCRALLREGFAVRTVDGAAAAMVELRRRVPDALVSDVHMPDVDGMALLRTALAEHPGLIVVLVSGDSSRPCGAIEGGAVGFLTKPVDLDELVSVLDSSLQVRSERKLAAG